MGYNLLFFTVTTFTAAHFKIVAMILRDSSNPILFPDFTQEKEMGSTDSKSDNESMFKEQTYLRKGGKEFRKSVGLKYGIEQEVALSMLTCK
jgi:hypothetical protein